MRTSGILLISCRGLTHGPRRILATLLAGLVSKGGFDVKVILVHAARK